MRPGCFNFRSAGLALAMALTLSAPGATYYVNSISALTTRLNAAVAGDEIVMSNGVYTTSASLGIARAGTAANRIVIRAETIGGVEITGTHGFSFNSGAAYVTVQGFKFTHANSISMGSGANHCRLTRNVVQLTIPATNDVSYINISGDDMEVDRNELRNKSTLGNMLDITGSGSQVARRLWVHHNYFRDFTSPGGNGAETIRWGLSGLSLSTGNGLCEYNLFVRCDGENEMISNKSSGNTYRYNTVLDAREISQRHGNDCLYYGNYMRNSEGIRVYGDRHKIFCNYFEGNSVGVNMGNGDGDVYNGAALTAHDRPDDNVVMFNTFINNSTHYEMGGRTGGLGSSNSVVANNIFLNGGNIASISTTAPYTGTYTNNLRWNTSSTGNMPASGYSTVNPLLATDASGIYHIQSNSPAINAGRAAFDYYGALVSYVSVTNDMDGQPRDANLDIGADEFSAAPITAKFLTTNDVGPNSFTTTFSLLATPASRTVQAGVASNATYTITVTTNAGFTGSIGLSVGGLPTNSSASFSPATLAGAGSSTLTVSASNSTPAGNYTLTITGTNAGVPSTATATLTVSTSDSLVARFTFDDGTASDLSGYGNHGTLVGGASVISDPQRGKVLSLDGASGYVDLGNAISLDLSVSGQATIAAWLKVALSHNHNTILSKGEWKEAYSVLIKGDTTPKDQLWTGNDTSVFSIAPVPTNTWVHVAMTINGSLTTFYLYGQLAGATNQDRGSAMDATTTDVCLGREQYSGSLPAGRWFFNGLMDDVRIYSRALTQAEIQALAAGPPPPRIAIVGVIGANLVFNGTNGVAGGSYYVLTSTNVALPWANWTRVATNQFAADGSFVCTNGISPVAPQRFYLLQLP
ncbi:MAG: hypothetical protein EPO07_12195 [Verrucomicrobia bacterium]|nr:MAG: hypothetical protein EPO07_12195 [Verrucomicrobiota bacterium]